MKHYKRLVVDLDDTLSYCTDRDFDNAKPNLELINKLKLYHATGYEIIVLTARGQLSCEGNYKKADKKYRKSIEAWLEKNDVPYHELSFNKILAQLYIDDKGITPQNFVNIQGHGSLTKGLSGAEVTLFNNTVFKTCDNALEQVNWYDVAGSLFNTPKINNLIGNTISMEYIPEAKISDLLKAEMLLQNYIPNILVDLESKVMWDEFEKGYANATWESYTTRVQTHMLRNNLMEQDPARCSQYLEKLLTCQPTQTFSHGDLSLDNIIVSEKRANHFYLIDPIYNKETYSSYVLDGAKLSYSLREKGLVKPLKDLYEIMYEVCGISEDCLFALELSHWVRVLTYLDNPKKRRKYIKFINTHLSISKLSEVCY